MCVIIGGNIIIQLNNSEKTSGDRILQNAESTTQIKQEVRKRTGQKVSSRYVEAGKFNDDRRFINKDFVHWKV